jgi:hypothetical protein
VNAPNRIAELLNDACQHASDMADAITVRPGWPTRAQIRAAKAEREEEYRRRDVERSEQFRRYSDYMDTYCAKHGRSPLITFEGRAYLLCEVVAVLIVIGLIWWFA